MKNRAIVILSTLALTLGFLLVPSVATPQLSSQASASSENVVNEKASKRNITIRIWERGSTKYFDMIVGPDVGVYAGPDRISSYYIPRGVCASVKRGGVPVGTKHGPDRVGLAQGERISVLTWSCSPKKAG
jgi:hypothetical protein